jgi:prevent-host-death family protein
MQTVNIHEAKTHLSKLVARAKAGETIIIAKSGEPWARLVPLEDASKPKKREFGWLRGQIDVPEDFDTMFQKEIEEMFGELTNPPA